MASTLTTTDVLNWLNASTNSNAVVAATPDATTLSLIQGCLDSAIASVESYCTLPVTYPVEVEQAILMLAARLWDRRKTSNGLAMGEFGFVRVGAYDPDVEKLLEPHKRFSFGVAE